MAHPNLLVELFVEELPPKALRKLGEAFGSVLLEQLRAQGLATADSALTTFASPRRLAAHVTNVASQAPDQEVIEKLVPMSVGVKDGKPTEALRKRLGKIGRERLADLWPNSVDGPDSLFTQSDGKVESIYLRGLAIGTSLQVGLLNSIERAVTQLPIPKVMTYQLADGWTDVKFVRPAHGLVALHGAEVVPLELLGLAAGRVTHGHRFEAAAEMVTIPDADSYAQVLAEQGAVIAGFEARRAEIVRQLQAAAQQVGAGARPIEDDALLDEVTALVERPNVLVCQFEPAFLDVPQECLILTMKANQKYFPLLDAQGRLTNRFLVVSNIRPQDPGAVVGGNERVVRPRLADAKFFFDQDRKKTLASRVEGLARVVYHNKLGTQGERTERVRRLAQSIARTLATNGVADAAADRADTAAQLAKADLLTDMVGEFPELQGTMGRYYALHDGLPQDIADAVEDHYKPRFAGDQLPRGTTGLVVALADKLETLAGLFAIGQLPTGDKDPFALRRHALGIVRMLIEKDLPLDLGQLLAEALALFPQAAAATREQLAEFIFDRLAGALREQGYSAQEVDAVLALRPQRLGDVAKRLQAVRAFAALPEAPALAAANKRIGNILKKADGSVDAQVSEGLLHEAAEKALYAATRQLAPAAQAQFDAGDYTASLQTLAALRAPVDAFFDDVMVNAEQADLRRNRLGLLATLHGAMNRVADLSRLAT
ncbi:MULTISPECIES: glycine--tRNA ligase subunit beta [Ramlibacter]|uniref:Glycine--tRNA ligase beta subunit n=1 Tax=Ramlibacter pinisoli TaxID=2682844 RepID=A0A6N8J3E6_9BURK|nr:MULTISPECIES: glycine--tRNA ligase subunit beta [Ramlibacter]MBA2962804.1 glycine--tRNA ligase subunit beta [Ramlibacter sp. CGMCC 1.13660]MVQ32746.1 glycine--tRNA ligase subunit beta [Ramlibacter pinisoli]